MIPTRILKSKCAITFLSIGVLLLHVLASVSQASSILTTDYAFDSAEISTPVTKYVSLSEELTAKLPEQRPIKPVIPYRLSMFDRLLENYDKRASPTFGTTGTPTPVDVNIHVNSLGSVSAANMDYTMDIYLRQYWTDPRLNMTGYGIKEALTLNGEEISKRIWTPELFFLNVKEAHFHYVTIPNKLFRVTPEGRVLFSMRLTLRLSCHMSFRNYPLDTQTCHVVIGSYGQTTDQTTTHWQGEHPIIVDKKVEVPEYHIISVTNGQFTRHLDTGSFSFLNVTIVLQRQNGFHVVQTYLPTFLIVMISWVSFWLNVDAAPARVTLGVTTLLALTTVASGVRSQLPPVSYVKAIDVWMGVCSIMVFGALLEFALVNFLSRSKPKAVDYKPQTIIPIFQLRDSLFRKGGLRDVPQIEIDPPATNVEANKPVTTPASHLKKAKFVDRVSRLCFPLAFFLFNAVYWPFYLTPEVNEVNEN